MLHSSLPSQPASLGALVGLGFLGNLLWIWWKKNLWVLRITGHGRPASLCTRSWFGTIWNHTNRIHGTGKFTYRFTIEINKVSKYAIHQSYGIWNVSHSGTGLLGCFAGSLVGWWLFWGSHLFGRFESSDEHFPCWRSPKTSKATQTNKFPLRYCM